MTRRGFFSVLLGSAAGLVAAKLGGSAKGSSLAVPQSDAKEYVGVVTFPDAPIMVERSILYSMDHADGTSPNRDEWLFEWFDGSKWITASSGFYGKKVYWSVPERAQTVRMTPVKSLMPPEVKK